MDTTPPWHARTSGAFRSPRNKAGAAAELGRVGLAVVRLGGGGDGIAYVARLLDATLRSSGADSVRTLELGSEGDMRGARRQQAEFIARLLVSQLARKSDWWMFNHLGIARAQLKVPAAFRKPYAVFLNGIEAWEPELSEERKRVLRGARALISISRFTAQRVASVHPELGRIRPCPLGLLPIARTGHPPEASLLSRIRPRSVLIVGRMSASERYKGHDQLIECWPRVLTAVPDAQLIIAGRGDDLERLRAKAREGGIGEHIVFTGFVSDATLQALMRRVAVFAMPSRGEGFGLAYLEAMRAGIPCVGSTADAAVDVIMDGETGLLVDPDDRVCLATALCRLLEDDNWRRAMGRAGRRRFDSEFTYERFRARLLPILVDSFGPRTTEDA